MKTDYKEFDMNKKPKRANILLYPLMVILSWFSLRFNHYKIKKINCKGLKGPYIVLATHAGMIDFNVAVQAVFPSRPTWVSSIEEFNRGEWLMRGVGCMCKRKFTKDIVLVKHILYALKKKWVVIIYPEARYSLAGVNERIDKSLGKLVKKANVPVVVLRSYGHFIKSPQWNKHPYRKIPVYSEMIQVCSKDDVMNLTSEEIQNKIEENFICDDYKYQHDNNFIVDEKFRMDNAHKILYKCPHCKKEFMMVGKGTKIKCNNCNIEYELDEKGYLHCLNGETKFNDIPSWYYWERNEVIDEVNSGKYYFEDEVSLEQLFKPNIGFKYLGNVHFTHDINGMKLEGKLLDGENFEFFRPSIEQESCHIEYFFKDHNGKLGPAIDVASIKKTYFIWLSDKNKEALTKIHFATEAIYDLVSKK